MVVAPGSSSPSPGLSWQQVQPEDALCNAARDPALLATTLPRVGLVMRADP